MKKIFIPLFLILLTTFSCRKYGEGYIRGNVYEAGTNIPLAGIPVILSYFPINNGGSPSPVSSISTHSDKNGYYILYYDNTKNAQYTLSCRTDSFHLVNPYKTYSSSADFEGTGPNFKKEIIDFSLYPCGYIKLHIIKTTNYQWGSQNFNINGGKNVFNGGNFIILNNNPFDTIIPRVFRVIYNNQTQIESDLIYSNGVQQTDTTVIVGKGDTLLYTIQYK